jgi:hypothetical protein
MALIDRSQFLYQSPPNSGRNDGALPLVYDPGWNDWSNLTPQQTAAFQAFPQDLFFYIGVQRWQWETRGRNTPGPPTSYITIPADGSAIAGIQLTMDDRSQNKISGLRQNIDNGVIMVFPFPFIALNGVFMLSAADCRALHAYCVRYVQSTYAIAASLIAQVQGGTLKTRAPIDAAFAAIVVQ